MSDRMEPPEPECPRCGRYLTDESMDENKCEYCGFDGTIEQCDGCGVDLHPSNLTGLCKECQLEEQRMSDKDELEFLDFSTNDFDAGGC